MNGRTLLRKWIILRQKLQLGVCVNVFCLGVSQILYSASMHDTPNKYASLTQSLPFQFLWKNKADKSNREVLYQDYGDGGLQLKLSACT